MKGHRVAALAMTTCIVAMAAPARAQAATFDISAGRLSTALDQYVRQTGRQVLYKADETAATQSKGAHGVMTAEAALDRILAHTGFAARLDSSGAIAIVRAGTASDARNGGDVEPAAADTRTDPGAIQDIIVTAQRKSENLQKVPVVVTVVSQAALEKNNIQTLGDLQYIVPSMSATSVYSRDGINLAVRGQQATPSSSVQAVVTYLNDVPIPTGIGGDVAGGPGLLFDLENVQVLKGPQGTLFGRNATGGAVLFQSARPRNELGGALQATYGNYNDRELTAMLNVPIVSDTLLVRVAFAGQLREGFTYVQATPNHPNGVDADNRGFWAARGTASWHPLEAFQNDLIVSYSKYDNNGSPNLLTAVDPNTPLRFFYPGFLQTATQQASLGPREALAESVPLASFGRSFMLQNISRLSLGSGVTFKNIFGYVYAKTGVTWDFDGTKFGAVDISDQATPLIAHQYTDEMQLSGTGFGGKLDWILGGFYLDETTGWLHSATTFYQGSTALYSLDKQDSKALFGQGTYDLSALVPHLKFRLGGRYTWDHEVYRDQNCPQSTASQGFTNNAGCTVPSRYEVKNAALTWTTGLDYQLNHDTLLYVAARRGYRAGSFNGGDGHALVPQFRPEFVTDVELGVKADWRIGGVPMRLDAAIFHDDYTDIQVQRSTGPVGNLVTVISNDGDARILGAEAQFTVHPTRNLRLDATFAYLDFKYTHFNAGVTADTIAQDLAEVTQNRPPYKVGLGASYTLPLAPDAGSVTLAANWHWQDASALAIVNPQDIDHGGMIRAFDLLNVSADWHRALGYPVDLSFFMSNALNKTYVMGGTSLYTALGFTVAKYGEPRMFGFRLKYFFGAQ